MHPLFNPLLLVFFIPYFFLPYVLPLYFLFFLVFFHVSIIPFVFLPVGFFFLLSPFLVSSHLFPCTLCSIIAHAQPYILLSFCLYLCVSFLPYSPVYFTSVCPLLGGSFFFYFSTFYHPSLSFHPYLDPYFISILCVSTFYGLHIYHSCFLNMCHKSVAFICLCYFKMDIKNWDLLK